MHVSFQNIPPPSAFLCSSGEMPAHIGGSVPEGQSGFAGWQRQQRRSTASLQPTGWTRLNPAGRGMCIEKHWPGIRNVRLTLLNDSLATMSIRPTPSSLFDIKAKESEQEEGEVGNEWSEITEERGREGRKDNQLFQSISQELNSGGNVGAESQWCSQHEWNAAYADLITRLWNKNEAFQKTLRALVMLEDSTVTTLLFTN